MDDRKYWTKAGPFPELTFDWFRQLGAQDPEDTYTSWKTWTQKHHSNDTKLRKALALVTGLKDAAVGHYLTQYVDPTCNRADHLGEATLRWMDTIAEAVGLTPAMRVESQRLWEPRGALHIALLADLGNVPSPRFHLNVIESIVNSGSRLNYTVALYPVSQGNIDLYSTVQRILRSNHPHGVIWFRITPNGESLSLLLRENVPAVVVHGERVKYPAPVVAHVIPAQQSAIPRAVKAWLARTDRTSGQVVIAGMNAERPVSEFDPMDADQSTSLRLARLLAICAGVRGSGFEPSVAEVDDYTGSAALDLVERNPQASAFICLSDELGLAVKQIIQAKGHEWHNQVLGFDGSDFARRYDLPTIDQKLNEIGQKAVNPLKNWFRRAKTAVEWPPFVETGSEPELIMPTAGPVAI